jgi:hypothetical protein
VPSPISFSTSPPASWNELARWRAVGDGGVAAQVREPQRRLDAVGNAALDAAFEHAPAGVAAEIDLDQSIGDLSQRRALDGQMQHRHEAAQGGDIVVVETPVAARRPA